MFKDFLRGFRDYCYNEIKNNKDQMHADSNYGMMFAGGLLLYYLTIPLSISLVLGRFGYQFSSSLKSSLLLKLLLAFVIFYPFFKLMKITIRRLSAYPIDKYWSKDRLQSVRILYIFFMFFGFIVMISALWILTRLLY